MKQDCTFFELQLVEYVGASLGPAAARQLENHLAGCANCRAELARERELRELLGTLPTAQCPDLRMPVGGRAWPARGYLGAGLVAAVLLAVLFVPGLLSRSPSTSQLAATSHRPGSEFTATEISQARHDALATLVLTASVLDRSRDRTVVEIFGHQLPRAVSGSLNRLDSPRRNTINTPDPTPTGGQG